MPLSASEETFHTFWHFLHHSTTREKLDPSWPLTGSPMTSSSVTRRLINTAVPVRLKVNLIDAKEFLLTSQIKCAVTRMTWISVFPGNIEVDLRWDFFSSSLYLAVKLWFCRRCERCRKCQKVASFLKRWKWHTGFLKTRDSDLQNAYILSREGVLSIGTKRSLDKVTA